MNQNRKNAIGYIVAGAIFLVLDLWIFLEVAGGSGSVSVPRILYVFYTTLGVEITSLLFGALALGLIVFGAFKLKNSANSEVEEPTVE